MYVCMYVCMHVCLCMFAKCDKMTSDSKVTIDHTQGRYITLSDSHQMYPYTLHSFIESYWIMHVCMYVCMRTIRYMTVIYRWVPRHFSYSQPSYSTRSMYVCMYACMDGWIDGCVCMHVRT